MTKELKVKEGRQGQEVNDGPNRYVFEPGEWVEVDEKTFENHKDRDVFEARGGDEAEYECGECGETFDSKQGLGSHERTHEDTEN